MNAANSDMTRWLDEGLFSVIVEVFGGEALVYI